MKIQRRLALAALPILSFAGRAWPQADYPAKPITVIVPFGAGGIADITARAFGQELAKTLKQAVVIDNRPSAGNIVGSNAVATAAPDGYTLLLMSNGNAVSQGLFKKLPYDVVKAFEPISTLGYFDLALFVDAKSKFGNVRELLAFAKTNPGKLTVGTIAVGSTQNLSAELFKTATGIQALIVPYNGTPALQTALRSGQVDVGFEVLGSMMAQLAPSGLRALAVTGGKRFPGLPEVPTVQEAGVAGYDVASWNALAAPARTPPAVIAKLNAAVNEAAKSPDLQQRLQGLGVRAQGSTPQQLGQLVNSEVRRWGDVIKKANIDRQ